MPDEYGRYYAALLNGYFRLAYSPGSFRTWWRNLHQGSDADLDNAHQMRLAGRLGRRASRQGLDFVKENNCFTMVADGAQLAKMVESLILFDG